MIDRRGLITGLVSFMAAPAIVRAASLMPVRAIVPYPLYGISPAMVVLPYLEELQLAWQQYRIELAELLPPSRKLYTHEL